MLRARPALWAAACLLLVAVSGCREEDGIEVRELSFAGVEAIPEGQLRAVLATQPSDRLPWGTRRFFDRRQFEADLKRIVAFYRDRGFPDAQVTSFDVRLAEDQESVRLHVVVSEGEPIVVERIAFEGFGLLPPDSERTLRRRLPLQPGQPLDRALLQASRELVLDEWREHGYPYVRVRAYEEAGRGPRQRTIFIFAESGPLTFHGPVEIAGNRAVEDRIVRRQLTFREGDIFRQSRVVESQRRLYQLELFDFANVQPMRTEERLTQIPTRVTVSEGPPRRVNLGLGYGSEERARAQIDWRHVNFLGDARTAGVLARYSALDAGVRLNFRQPYFLHPRYSFGLQGQSWYTSEPAYTLITVGGRASLTRQFARGGRPVMGRDPATTLVFTYINEWEEYEVSPEALADLSFRPTLIALRLDPRTGVGRGQRSGVAIDIGRNTTGNILDATRGYVATAHLEQAGQWLGGSFNFYEVTLEGRYYQSLGGRAVAAVRGRAGTVAPFGELEPNIPFYKRYFLGGATSLRGWGRFEVSPLSGAGLPIGGHSFAELSTELRFPVWRALGGVLFMDAGNVWANPWDMNLNDLRYSVGPGLRYNTPVGPVRLDVGYQLNPIPGLAPAGEEQTRRFRFHFSIGQAF